MKPQPHFNFTFNWEDQQCVRERETPNPSEALHSIENQQGYQGILNSHHRSTSHSIQKINKGIRNKTHAIASIKLDGSIDLHRVRHELDGQTSKREIHAPCEDCDDDDGHDDDDDDDDDDDGGDAPHVVIASPGKAHIYIYIYTNPICSMHGIIVHICVNLFGRKSKHIPASWSIWVCI